MRGKFSLSNTKLLSCDMGEIVPIGLTEVLPGDTFQQSTSLLVRVAPLLAPVMHPVEVKVHHWYVPHRLVWEDFEDFITGGPDGDSTPLRPTITVNTGTGWAIGSLADYLGVPTGVDDKPVSALPFRGYAKIFNEFYRDQDLVDELVVSEASGPDTTTSTVLQNAAWEKDYFTSARPFTQKGPAIVIPFEGQAPVVGIGKGNQTYSAGAQTVYETGGTASTTYDPSQRIGEAANLNYYVEEDDANPGFPGIFADLAGADAIPIAQFRRAMALQRYEEARARYGSRYTEYLRYAFGVRSSDARLQRPEYLGGGKQTLQFSEVLQTGVTTDADDSEGVGNMKGHGIGAMRSNRYRRYFEEHGFVFTFMVVRPKTIYAQGLPRHWSRATKEDYFQKELQAIGQQEIFQKEIYWGTATPDAVFGYQDRYDEYRRQESSIAGEFRDTTLNYWHYARIFGSEPSLNDDFVTSIPTKRVNAVQTNDVLYVMANHSIQARRSVAKTGKSFIY